MQLLAACPTLLIQRGERRSVGRKEKHEDGITTGEMRGGRMKDTGEVGGGISPQLR